MDSLTKVEAVEAAYKSGLDGISIRQIYDLNNPDALRHRNVQTISNILSDKKKLFKLK